MDNFEEIDRCIEIIKEMFKRNERITIFSDIYDELKNTITGYVCLNGFENTEEWSAISNAMIYKSTEYLSSREANIILINLEKLKRKAMLNEQERLAFDKHVHSLISEISKEKFFNGYYADAVESAFKEINQRCKKIYKDKTGIEDDGASLMNRLFSLNNPQLVFEDVNSETGKNVQNGYMQIFAGSMIGIRNPKAHENQYLDKESAYKRLILASLLMDKIDEAIKNEQV